MTHAKDCFIGVFAAFTTDVSRRLYKLSFYPDYIGNFLGHDDLDYELRWV